MNPIRKKINTTTKSTDIFYRIISQSVEFSKQLAIIDTIVYIVLMAALIIIMVLKESLASHATNAMIYITTTCVSLRLGYSFKAMGENMNKIKNSIIETTTITETDENSNG